MGPRRPLAGYLNRTTPASGKEKSLRMVVETPSFSMQAWVDIGSMLVGPESSSALNTVHRL
jgi:hypothetical protein